MALLVALVAVGNSTTNRGAGMAPAPLEPARRGGHDCTARHPWVALHTAQNSKDCWAAAAAAATTTADATADANAYGHNEPRRHSATEDKALRATPGRAIRAPWGRGLSPNWGGGLSANPTWSAMQCLQGPRMPSEQPDRASEHESTRPQCPNRSPLPTSTTHHRPAMLTSDARPRSLPRKPTRLKLVPHNYNSKKKTTNGPSPPEKNQNPPKNSRNRSGPPNLDPHNYNSLKKTFTGPPPFEKKKRNLPKNSRNRSGPRGNIRYPESNYPQAGRVPNYSPTSNRPGVTAGTLLLSVIKQLEIYASRKRDPTQIEKYGAPKLGDHRQVPARVWVDPIYLIRTTNRSSKRPRSRRPRKGKRRPKKARPATARTALGTTTHRAQQAHRRERSEWRVARRKRRRRDDG